MPHIYIDRPHGLGLSDAQAIALEWAKGAQYDFGMQAHQGPDPANPAGPEAWHFKRVGASGVLRVTSERFVLDVQLGFLLGTFKDRIEDELLRNLAQRLSGASTNESGRDPESVMIPK